MWLLISGVETARDSKLEILELWSFVTSAIKGPVWAPFRLIMSIQTEYKEHKAHWLIDNIREHVLAIEDDDDSSTDSREKFSALSAAKGVDKDEDLREVVLKLAETVAAINTNIEVASRNKYGNKTERPQDKKMCVWEPEKPYDKKMGRCRFCGGFHRHRDCSSLKTDSPKPDIPPRLGAARSAVDNAPGFLMGAIATKQPTELSSQH